MGSKPIRYEKLDRYKWLAEELEVSRMLPPTARHTPNPGQNGTERELHDDENERCIHPGYCFRHFV
eukprot:3682201-Amphidinium_carterae.3